MEKGDKEGGLSRSGFDFNIPSRNYRRYASSINPRTIMFGFFSPACYFQPEIYFSLLKFRKGGNQPPNSVGL